MNRSGKQPLFVADRMLGKLARYLRLLGYDVAYPPPCSDARLIAMARSEERVLLTRDQGIAGRESALSRSPRVVYITSTFVLLQLAQLAEEGWISSIHSPRCSICNTPLEEVDVHEARHMLHPFTTAIHNSFLYCPSCNILLWEGSHWVHFRKQVSRILR